MIDVRITAYVSPVAEQPQASLTPIIHVINVGDEDTRITGLIRIYRESTGLLIYTSELVPTVLAHDTETDIAALTPFDPPAPADDDYFIKADGLASSFLPGPPLAITLGAWHFDIKTPPMGEAPAGHHVTHEDGGSDELDVTGLSGQLNESQTPTAHAASHQDGGADELDHGTLPGLADDDHPQYKLRHEIFYESELLEVFSAGVYTPWKSGAISSGTLSAATGSDTHPGIVTISSSTSANSGARLTTYTSPLLIAGNEKTKAWIRPLALPNTTMHFGFHNTTSVSDPSRGAWIRQDPATGIIYGRCTDSGGPSTTGTGFQLVVDTWYLLLIQVNADASQIDFYCFADDGSELWHDSLTTNIPDAPGEELGNGIVVTNSDTSAVPLTDVDYLSLLIPDRRPDL
jgi:hypothetical protein